jgi:hypothetical protein
MYHAGMENFVSVLKSSSPKKLRKQQNELKKVEKEGESRNQCQPKKEPKDTDERESNSNSNNHINHAENYNAKAKDDQSNNRRVTKKKKCGGDGISPKRWQDDAYLATSSDSIPLTSLEGVNDNNNSSSKMKKKKQRRGVNNYAMYQQHSLIQSPLQRHIQAVHESACSNATCTVMKEPFQLQLVPSSSSGEETLATATAKTRQVGGGGSDHHLDMLGAVAGHSMNYKKDGNNNDRDTNVGGDINNVALDLLTSAAFLFKTSRRNIL